LRQKFEEQSAVNWEITTDTKTNASVECACADPIGPAARCKTKDTSEEESKVESETATDNVRGGTPEGSANAETKEER